VSNSKPQFAVVIPVYNRSATIQRALDSVLAQSYPATEIVVVDDGSTDDSAGLIQAYDGVRYVQQENAGASAARNLGVAQSTAPWIAFLDSDDYWRPGHLERVAAAIEGTQGAARLYFSDAQLPLERGGGQLWDKIGFEPSEPYDLQADATDWAALPAHPMLLPASVFQREFYDRSGGLNPRLPSREDTHLFLLTCLGGSACAVAGVGLVVTSDDRSGSRLTAAFGQRTRAYSEATRWLYSDVIRRARLPQPVRRDCRERLAAAHLQLARADWAARKPGVALAHGVRALLASPARCCRGVFGRRS